MKTKFALGFVVMLLASCSQTPLGQVAQSREVYTGTLRVLIDARKVGMISDKEYRTIEQYREAAEEVLERMEKCALENDRPGYDLALLTFNQALDKLLAIRLEIERVKVRVGSK